MNPNTLRWFGASAAVAAAVLCWYLLSMEPDSAPRTVGKVLARAAHVSDKQSASKPAGPLPKLGSPEFKRTRDRLLAYLESQERDASGLVAMWDLTGDEALLAEAAEKFPDDPRVCMAMILRAGNDALKATPWITRLLAAEPNNPEGLYQKAWTLMAGNDRAGAIEALRQAGAMPRTARNSHLGDRIETIRDAALWGEASPTEVARLVVAPSLQMLVPSLTLSSAAQALNEEMLDAKSAGDPGRLMEVGGIAVATAERLAYGGAVSLRDEMAASDLAAKVLSGPPCRHKNRRRWSHGWSPIWGGDTVARKNGESPCRLRLGARPPGCCQR